MHLRWFAAAAVVCITSSAIEYLDSRQWLIQTHIQVQGVDGISRRQELRVPCCADIQVEGDKFCESSDLLPHDCIMFKAYLAGLQQGNQACRCHAHSTTHVPQQLKTLPFNVHHADTARSPTYFQLSVFEGDTLSLPTRIPAVCRQFNLDVDSCSMFSASFTQQVIDADVEHAMAQLLTLSPHATYPLDVLRHVLAHVQTMYADEQRRHRHVSEAYRTLRHQLQREKDRQIQTTTACATADQVKSPIPDPTPSTDAASSCTATIHSGPALAIDDTLPSMKPSLPIPRVDIRTLSYSDYLALAKGSVPLILTHSPRLPQSPGIPPWSLDVLNATCGTRSVVLKRRNPTKPSWAGIEAVARADLRQFLHDIQHKLEPWPASLSSLYLHDMSVIEFCPDLLQSFVIPKLFVRDALQTTCTKNTKYWPSLFVGDVGTSSGLHTDWGATAAWMGLLHGRKRWRIAPPSARPFVYERVGDGDGKFDADLMAPNTSAFPLLRHVQVFEGVLEAGEIMFIPADSPHQVVNLDLSIAVAMNFVDAANIDAHMDHVRHQLMEAAGQGHSAIAGQYEQVLASLEATSRQWQVQDESEPAAMAYADYKRPSVEACQAKGTWIV
ncbi:hypothetical protein H310_08854 [Aphanomyces invadans]|uniref:JmjC domain-containing protein n=1 Tax=Aphanomyces invadans TaxID=157072 RepID=A0A024TVA4_9STRA|nr:hypothetical protein H310_08854 [Aphanomyces invadans]ETV98110.1 hypothetical protein H310_08854 [Aphanomyces invadans]|eukprot:XP_008872985.1 hypothetical protein H310_08854 [Aphanomyces invadans]